MDTDRHVVVGGDFNRIFDHKDYLAMVSIPDEATSVLRTHLILEEVLNLWASKLTGTEDLYAGAFVPFKLKAVISRNLGMNDGVYNILDKINNIRNRFSHRKGFELEKSAIESLADRVDSLESPTALKDCREFHMFVGSKNQDGNPAEKTYTWANGDNRIKFLLVFVTLMLKLTSWIQREFNERGIQYTIIATDES